MILERRPSSNRSDSSHREDQVHILFTNVDLNGNGLVEFNELANGVMPDMKGKVLVNQWQLLEMFQSFDRDGNGNGYISVAELTGVMAKMGQPLTYKKMREIIKETDADGDGIISFDEFTSVMGGNPLLIAFVDH